MVLFSAEAKLFMSTYYGIGNNKVDLDMYQKVTYGIYAITISVTKNECAPMTQRREYKGRSTDIELRGLTLGIKDMSVFDVPKDCQNGTSMFPFSTVSLQLFISAYIRVHSNLFLSKTLKNRRVVNLFIFILTHTKE